MFIFFFWNSETDKQIKGDNYEKFILEKFKADYDDIWLWKDVPESILFTYGIIKNYDIFCKYRNLGDLGVDIVAIKNNVPYFIQCKNFQDTIMLDTLAGFYCFLFEYECVNGILCYNGKLSQRIQDISKRIKLMNVPFENQVIIKEITNEKFVPRDYQIEAFDFLKNKHRSVLNLPCAMGKTFCSSMIAKRFNNVIIFSPLRELARQNLHEISKHIGDSYESLLISVDGTRDLEKINLKKKNIISATYDSVDVVNKIIGKLEDVMIIIDEFHNISDNDINGNTEMGKILRSRHKILFLSATPKHLERSEMFGSNIYSYKWKDAIEKKYINDFEIVMPSKGTSLKNFDELLKSINKKYKHNKMACKIYFLIKGILYNGDKKIIIYLTTIEKANEAMKIINWIKEIFNVTINTSLIDYKTTNKQRQDIIKIFNNDENIHIICNVHILDEGIDVPLCDAVYITQPNNNILNLVQRMSRCIRMVEDKRMSHIYIWCTEKKTDTILKYLSKESKGYFENKVTHLTCSRQNPKILSVTPLAVTSGATHLTVTPNAAFSEIKNEKKNVVDTNMKLKTMVQKPKCISTQKQKSTSEQMIKCCVCDFFTEQKRYMKQHIGTVKHMDNLGKKSNDNVIKNVYECKYCKEYFYKKALKYHQDNNCKKSPTNSSSIELLSEQLGSLKHQKIQFLEKELSLIQNKNVKS